MARRLTVTCCDHFRVAIKEFVPMKIASVASAFPNHYYTRDVLVAALKNFWGDRLPSPGLLDRLDESMKVDGRYLVRPLEYYLQMDTWGQANNTWIECGMELGEKALCRALTSV